jgi:hypothetical protein
MSPSSLHCYSYRLIGKLFAFLQFQEFSLRNPPVEKSTCGLFHFRRTAFFSYLKSKVGSTLAKAAALRIN